MTLPAMVFSLMFFGVGDLQGSVVDSGFTFRDPDKCFEAAQTFDGMMNSHAYYEGLSFRITCVPMAANNRD